MTAHRQQHRGTGWIVFSGILLVLAGTNILINGLWALHANSSINNSQLQNSLLFSGNNLDTWGWIYTIAGGIIAIVGLGVFFRSQWAVYLGLMAATVGIVLAFFWLFTPYWPDALISILLASLVIHGLARYGIEEEVPVA